MSNPVQQEGKAAAVTFVPGKGVKEETEDEKTVPLLEDEYIMDDEKDTTTPRVQPKMKIDIYNSVSEENQHLVKEAGQGGMVVGLLVGGSDWVCFGRVWCRICRPKTERNRQGGTLVRKSDVVGQNKSSTISIWCVPGDQKSHPQLCANVES